MTFEFPFSENDHIELLDDWTISFTSHYTKERMWEALGCSNDPVNKAAWERWEIGVAEIQELHNRGPIVNKPSRTWDATTNRWLTSPTSREPQGKDARRIKALQKALSAEENLRTFAQATLPKGTILQVDRLTVFNDFETATIKLNIVETNHPGLQFKKDGGSLSNGKRNILIKGRDFAGAKFTIYEPKSGFSPIR
jgi:hypothetical protein